MILNAYSIFDRKTAMFHPPFFQSTDGAAARLFTDLCRDEGTTIHKHAADYVLYRLGTFHDQSGELHGCTPPAHVLDGSVASAPTTQE